MRPVAVTVLAIPLVASTETYQSRPLDQPSTLQPSKPLSTPLASPLHIVLSNDDGWAELNIRTTYDALTAANSSVLISAPVQDMTGKGKLYLRPGRS